MKDFPPFVSLSHEVKNAILKGLPMVALESAVITHGLPYPENLNIALDMEQEIRNSSVIPATIAVIEGKVCVGLDVQQIEILASKNNNHEKVSSRDIGVAVTKKLTGGTTVAGTLAVVKLVGLRVFSTGGIGGVHRNTPYDISADCYQLARTPVIVVCAGAKSIMDMAATLEVLETLGVPVIGWGTREWPGFYSIHSGLQVDVQVDTPADVVWLARNHWETKQESAVLVAVPPPRNVALPREEVVEAEDQAIRESKQKKLRGKQVTPYLLKRLEELSGGKTVRANLGLLRQNAQIAARIAFEMASQERTRLAL
ncbi:MAG: pseudouridine-5'-phosphate glycosidase [Chloroflexota bacterium]